MDKAIKVSRWCDILVVRVDVCGAFLSCLQPIRVASLSKLQSLVIKTDGVPLGRDGPGALLSELKHRQNKATQTGICLCESWGAGLCLMNRKYIPAVFLTSLPTGT